MSTNMAWRLAAKHAAKAAGLLTTESDSCDDPRAGCEHAQARISAAHAHAAAGQLLSALAGSSIAAAHLEAELQAAGVVIRQGWPAGMFRVAGFDDEAVEYTEPVAVTCPGGHRYDSGGDTADLAALITWAGNHQYCEPGR